MIEGTTPTFILSITDEDVDLTLASRVIVSFKQAYTGVDLRKEGNSIDVEAKQVSVYLTQDESLSFATGKPIDLQINWVYEDSSRSCTRIETIEVTKNLIEEVINP